jgi:hypothetical protein
MHRDPKKKSSRTSVKLKKKRKKGTYNCTGFDPNKKAKTSSTYSTILVAVCTGELLGLIGQLEGKYFDYFVFNIVNCDLLRSGARHHALMKTIGNAWGFDINSPRSAENHPKDL